MKRPPSGSSIYWRFKDKVMGWNYGYVTYLNSPTLIRLGRYNGDTTGGTIIDYFEIEWRHYFQ